MIPQTAKIRGFMDNVYNGDKLVVHEWKTGKEYDSHSLQRSLYGLASLLLFPEYDDVEVITVYLDQKVNRPTKFTKGQQLTYQWVWQRHINKTRPPQPYPMRPSWKCRFCNYSKNRGGKCPN